MTVSLSSIAVILVSPKHEGNIGATARAMANMGADCLILISPRCEIGDEAHRRACEGEGVLEKVKMAENLEEVAGQFQTLIATTARVGRDREPIISPREMASRLQEEFCQDNQVALVFGPEESGLDNAALQLCHHVVRVPIVEGGSLNLSHAVTILLYELRCEILTAGQGSDGSRDEITPDPTSPDAPAPNADVEVLLADLAEAGRAIDHLQPHNAEDWLWRYRKLFHRARLTNADLWMLRGLVRQIRWAADKNEK